MSYLSNIEQHSPEWWAMKVGKVSGTRFGQLISSRDNSLVEEMASEIMDGCCEMNDFQNDEMLFGVENEPIALDLLEKKLNIKFSRGGVLLNDANNIHMASPDGCNYDLGIVAEVKCTTHSRLHLKRFSSGIDTAYKGQLINYFAVDEKIKTVYFVSYCPFRPERMLVIHKFTRDSVIYETTKKTQTIQEIVDLSNSLLLAIKKEVAKLIEDFKAIEF